MRPTTRGRLLAPARLASVLALAVVLAGAFTTLAPSRASAADNGSWAVQPTSQKGTAVRQYFVYDLAAGTTVKDSVTIVNETTIPQTFQVYATDAFTTSRDGGLGFRSVDDPQHAIGAWTHVDVGKVTVPPRKRVDVPFQVVVPAGTAPGDEVGAIVALNTRIEGSPDGNVNIGVQKAVAARVYARVQGPVTPGLSVDGVTVDRSASPATVSYTLSNTGNVRLEPTAGVTVTGLLGSDLHTSPAASRGMLLPGESSQFTEPLDALPTLDYATVTVTAAAGEISATGQTHLWLVPWWLYLILGLLLAAIVGYLIRRRRAKRPTQPTSSDLDLVLT